MEMISSLEQFKKPHDGCVVTVGNFDGVHVGHQAIIDEAKRIAKENALPLVGMTFEPSPLAVLFPNRAPQILTPLPVKLHLLESLQIDQMVIVESTGEFLSLTAEEFIRDILVERIGVRFMVEGQTFNFGRQREGNIVSLVELGDQYHFVVRRVPSRTLFLDDGGTENRDAISNLPIRHSPIAVSSTLIRELVTSGQFLAARQCLGRWFELAGRVVKGQGIGRRLGFPTANLQLFRDNQLVPGDGVFAGWARFDDTIDRVLASKEMLPAAISIGRCETFDIGRRQIEAYLLDYPSDSPELYGKSAILTPVERIRPQKKFSCAEDLQLAIEEDCRRIKTILDRSQR